MGTGSKRKRSPAAAQVSFVSIPLYFQSAPVNFSPLDVY